MRRYGLRDDQWNRIKDILPGREGHVGGTAADNRLFVEAVLFRFRAGVPWRDLPERFGDWKIVYQRFNRWAKSGVFEGVFRLLASDHDSEYRECQDSCVRGRFTHHDLTNLSSNMIANWVLASHHSRGGIFHVCATWRKTRYSNLIAASSVGK